MILKAFSKIKNKKVFYTLLAAIVFFIVEYYGHNELAKFIESQARGVIAAKKLPIKFKEADYAYVPPRLILKEVDIKTDQVISHIESLKIYPSLLPLMKGKLRLKSILISKSHTSIQIKKTSANKSVQEVDLDKILKDIPLSSFEIVKSDIILLNKDLSLSFKDSHLNFIKSFKRNAIQLQSQVSIRENSGYKEEVNLSVDARHSEKKIFINFLTLSTEKTLIQSSGQIHTNAIQSLQKIKSYSDLPSIYNDIDELRLSTKVDLTDLQASFDKFIAPSFPELKKIPLSGLLQTEASFNQQNKNQSSRIRATLSDLQSPFVKLKSLNLDGQIQQESFQTKTLNVHFTKKSYLDFSKLKVNFTKKTALISSEFKTKQISVEDAINSFNAQVTNLKLPANLTAKCGGTLKPRMLLKCQGETQVKSFLITDADKKAKNKPLISTHGFSSNFNGVFTDTNFVFDASARGTDEFNPNLKASASGKVDYTKGFDIDYQAEEADLRFIKEIAEQKFLGLVNLSGNTKGSSKWGQFDAQIEGSSFSFNQLNLGDASGHLSYKFPYLKITNLKGSLPISKSTYQGSLALNPLKNKLSLDLKGNVVESSDVRFVFKDMFNMPEGLSFEESNFEFKTYGPTDINKASLFFKAKSQKINVFEELFTTADVHIEGENGKWQFLNSKLLKENSSVRVNGSLNGFKNIDLELNSNNLDFTHLTFLNSKNIKLKGPIRFNLKAVGPIEGTKCIGSLIAKNTTSQAGTRLKDSQVGFRLFEDEISLKGSLFGDSINGAGVYPITKKGKAAFSGTVTNFDLNEFVNLNPEHSMTYKMPLSFDGDFKSHLDSKNRIHTKGSLNALKLRVLNDNTPLLKIEQINGPVSLSREALFKVSGPKQTEGNLKLNLSKAFYQSLSFNGVLNLAFLKPLLPTSESINGTFKSDGLRLGFDGERITSEGSGEILNASFKSSSFPYTLYELSSPILAKGDKLLFSKLNAKLNNTTLSGQGFVSLWPFNTNLDFKYNGLSLNFPEKISSVSNGKLKLRGHQIPLQLSGVVDVLKGSFNKDVISSQDTETVAPNKYLPKKILNKSTPPALLNLLFKIRNGFKINSNEVTGAAFGNVRLVGNPNNPYATGKIHLKPKTKINFLDKSFSVAEGKISYSNQLINDPDLFIDSTAQVLDSNSALEQNYQIRMLVKGRGQAPSLNFNSQPSLSEKEIISLITIGTISTQTLGQEINSEQQATYSGLQFGSYLLQKNQAIRDLQKQTGTQIGLSSSMDSVNVNPKIEVKKKWSPKLSSKVTQTFGSQKSLSFSTEYKINSKVSSVLGVQNNQTNDASQLSTRRVQEGEVFELDLQYKFEFD